LEGIVAGRKARVIRRLLNVLEIGIAAVLLITVKTVPMGNGVPVVIGERVPHY
jgi:hypothetical protein